METAQWRWHREHLTPAVCGNKANFPISHLQKTLGHCPWQGSCHSNHQPCDDTPGYSNSPWDIQIPRPQPPFLIRGEITRKAQLLSLRNGIEIMLLPSPKHSQSSENKDHHQPHRPPGSHSAPSAPWLHALASEHPSQ